MTPGTYTIKIPTKAYLAQLISVQYGDPILLNKSSLLSIIILSLAQKRICLHYNLRKKHIMFRSYNSMLECLAPVSFMTSFGVDLSDDQIIQFNRYLDNEFDKSLYQFVQVNVAQGVRYKGFDNAILEFCKLYRIAIDEHITFDALKKSEYRYRKSLENKIADFVPSKITASPVDIYALKNNLADFVPSKKDTTPPTLF